MDCTALRKNKLFKHFCKNRYRLTSVHVPLVKPEFPKGETVIGDVAVKWCICDIFYRGRDGMYDSSIKAIRVDYDCQGKNIRVYRAIADLDLFLNNKQVRNNTLEKVLGLRHY